MANIRISRNSRKDLRLLKEIGASINLIIWPLSAQVLQLSRLENRRCLLFIGEAHMMFLVWKDEWFADTSLLTSNKHDLEIILERVNYYWWFMR